MKVIGQERNRERSEVGFQHRSDATDVIESVRILKVKGIIVATLEELSDCFALTGSTCFPVDPFVIQRYSMSE